MSADLPERPDMSDDLAQAYAQAHALGDDGRGPSAAVRANVLAAARAVAAEAALAQAAVDPAAPPVAQVPLTPVAPPVADVGRDRAPAINLSSWRVRSGAAFLAMLLVGIAFWRFDEHGRFSGGVQVALAELRLADAPTAPPPPRNLPMPAAAVAASAPYAAPPAVVEDPIDSATATAGASAKQAARDKNMIVAQADQAVNRAMRPTQLSEPVQARKAEAPEFPAPKAAEAAVPAAPPVVVASNSTSNSADVAGQPSIQEPTLVTIKGAPVQLATAPAMPPSILQRRIVVAQAPAAAPPAPAAPTPPAKPNADARAETTVAAAEVDKARADAGGARRESFSESLKKSAPGPVVAVTGSIARTGPTALHAAAERGDVETLKRLLAEPQAQVDAPDASGRTALLRAVLAQQVAAVRLLVAAGADPARADAAGLTPRAAAQTGASAEIAALLAAQR